MAISPAQRGVLSGMGGALAIIAAAGALTLWLQPFSSAILEQRLQLLALCALAPAATLAFCIARLANHRFTTPADIDGSGLTTGTAQARTLQALLQNTLEQVALAMPVYPAWVLLAPGRFTGLIATAALLFLLGRILFFRGYAKGAPSRALGFALTFYPTALLMAGALAAGGLARLTPF